jgi:hypothetical protein
MKYLRLVVGALRACLFAGAAIDTGGTVWLSAAVVTVLGVFSGLPFGRVRGGVIRVMLPQG